MTTNTNLTGAICGAIAGALAAVVINHAFPPKPRTVTVVSSAAVTSTTARRLADEQWPELEQASVDKLSDALRAVPADRRRPVEIVCFDDAKCGDLALNLENSFETARWAVDRKVGGMIGAADFGVTVSDEAVRDALAAAGVKASIVPALPEAALVVIGRMPKR